MDLLQEIDPRGLFFLSGDVHLAEASAATYKRRDGTMGQWVEVTSSGLTHTCADGVLNAALCPLMTSIFSLHRRTPGALFLGRNFGLIEGSAGSERRWLDIKIHSLDPVLNTSDPVVSYRLFEESDRGEGALNPIETLNYPHLAVLPAGLRRFVFIFLIAILYAYVVRAYMRKDSKGKLGIFGRPRDATGRRSRRKREEKQA